MLRSRRLIPILLALAVVVGFVVWRSMRPAPPTIVLISIDTLRPDQLGAYGNSPDISPNIDALAQQGALFEEVLALSPWTLPSHMTMLTGLDPVAHGVRRDGCMLSGRVTTLAEALQAAGFRTGGFTDGGFVSSRFGFGQGFEVYRDKRATDPGAPNGFRRLLPEALEWMHDTRNEPSFVFIHTFDVHTPYDEADPEILEQFRRRPTTDGPDDWQLHRLSFVEQQNDQHVTNYGRISELVNDYDAGVHEADRGVGQIVQELKETDRLENALIIVTSDHGESFAERGLHVGHGLALTDDELHVPLVLHLPRNEAAGQRIPTQVDLLDIAPTVLDFARVPAPDEMQGESLLGLLRGTPRRRTYSMGESQNSPESYLIANGFKFITAPSLSWIEVAQRHLGPFTPSGEGVERGAEYTRGKDENAHVLHYDFVGDPLGIEATMPQTPQLYDRAQDPLELHNLWEEDRSRVDHMAGQLKELYEASEAIHAELDDGSAPEPLDPHIAQQLDQLGYLANAQGGSGSSNLALPKFQRDAIRNPLPDSDDTLLVQTDRKAHKVRLQLKAGTPLPSGIGKWLEGLGNDYILWLSQNRGFKDRIVWRLAALMDLGQQAGLTDLQDLQMRWQRRVLEIAAHAGNAVPQSSDPGGDPAKAAVADPAPADPADPAAGGGDKPQR